MHSLSDLYAYNAWANRRVFAMCRTLDRSQLEERAPGTHGTIAQTLQHLVVVEDVYARMLRGDSLESVEARQDHDLDWFAERALRLGEEYRDLLKAAEAAFDEEPLQVPWFDFHLTKRDGLLQVLSHSAQHRAQVFSTLGGQGLEVPDLDYVLFVQAKGAGEE